MSPFRSWVRGALAHGDVVLTGHGSELLTAEDDGDAVLKTEGTPALCIAEAEGLDRKLSPWETRLSCDEAYRTIVWVVEAPGNALYVDARDGTLVEWAAVADGPP